MSIIQILKEDYLFEGDDTPGIEEVQAEEGMEPVDNKFTIALCNYLETIFPKYGTFDDQILNEIRKYMDETDSKVVRKTKEKIHNIILKEKEKLLKRIQHRMENVKVPKKGD